MISKPYKIIKRKSKPYKTIQNRIKQIKIIIIIILLLIHLVMLSFRQPLTVEQRGAYENESLHIKTTKFAGFHVFKGGNTIIKLAESIKSDLSSVQSFFAHVPDQPCDFSCPQGHLRSANSQFDCYNVSKSIGVLHARVAMQPLHTSARADSIGTSAKQIFLLLVVLHLQLTELRLGA